MNLFRGFFHLGNSTFKRTMATNSKSTRTYIDAVNALNNLQTNFAAIQAIRNSGQRSNELAIPQMIEWARRAGIEVCFIFFIYIIKLPD